MIIEAKPEHANEVCDVMKQSIVKLCIADHKNDSSILESWLSNKTPANYKRWIESEQSKFFVAISEGATVGIVGIGNNGYIYLCYMHPDYAGKGIGKRLLFTCEKQALIWGFKEITVDSSFSGKRFYESQGFTKNDEPFIENGLYSFPLIKTVKAINS